MICAIDPGLRHCGFALFTLGGGLMRAKLVKNTDNDFSGPATWKRMAHEVACEAMEAKTLLIEMPRIYPHSGQQKGDLNDLLQLSGIVGAISAHFPVVLHFYPQEWKGQLDKKAMNQRVLDVLQPGEWKNLLARDHNTLDAVGIGLYWFKRVNQKKVFR